MGLGLSMLLFSSVWEALVGSPAQAEVPDVVLVPPLFASAGVHGRSRAVKSTYARLLSVEGGPCRDLFRLFLPGGRHEASVLLTPPGADDFVISARLAGTERGSIRSDKPPEGSVAFRWLPEPTQPATFVELAAASHGLTGRASVLHEATGAGAFAEAAPFGGYRVGARVSTERVSVGAALVQPPPGQQADPLPLLAWLVARRGRVTFGVERAPVGAAALPPVSEEALRAAPTLAFMRQHGISAAVAVRTGLPGRASAFDATFEVTRHGELVLSALQHMAVRRRCKNPLEDEHVVGITNYLDFGYRVRFPLLQAASAGAGAAAAQPSFEFAGSWQVNKNVLLKGVLGTRGHEAAAVFKSWWTPAATLALSVSRRPGEKHRRVGASLALENVGRPVFERADPSQVTHGQVQRYRASQAELHEHDRPLVVDPVAPGSGGGGAAAAAAHSMDARLL